MSKDSYGTIPQRAFEHPLLARLSDTAAELTGIGFMVVFPDKDG